MNDYVLRKLKGQDLRSVNITDKSLSITYRKEVKVSVPVGILGIDLNYGNVTYSDSLGNVKCLPTREIADYKLHCRERKRRFTRNDVRIRSRIYGKYGKLQADKTLSEIHKHTSRIIGHVKKNHLAISLEDTLDKMQSALYRRGNRQRRDFRFRLNSWSRGEFKRQLIYKGQREGVSVFLVNPRGTSRKCSACGNKKMIPEENRILHCASCDLRIDRDRNAANNIRNLGLEKLFSTRFKPEGLPNEAMKRNPMKELTTEVILRADGSQIAS